MYVLVVDAKEQGLVETKVLMFDSKGLMEEVERYVLVQTKVA